MKIPGKMKKRGAVWSYGVAVGGRYHRVSLRTADRATAEVRAAEYYAAAVEAAKPREATVAEFAKRWLSEYVANRRNERGYELAEQRLRDWILPAIGDRVVARVGEAEALQVRQRLGVKSAPQTVVHVLADLRCLLHHAVRVGINTRPSCVRVAMPRIQERPARRYADEEIQAFRAKASPGAQDVIDLALETGLRRSELALLVWSDFVELPYPRLILRQTKSGRIREVPLLPARVERLRSLRGTAGAEDSILDLTPAGLSAMARRVGLSLHRLRHTFACRWLEAGGSVESLQAILGHSTVRLTERYGRVSAQAAARELTRIAGQLHTGQ